MTTVKLGFNDRLQDNIDLSDVLNDSRLENEVIASEYQYDAMESFEQFLKTIGRNEA